MCSTLIYSRESEHASMYKNVPGGKIFLFGVDGNGVEGVGGRNLIVGNGRFDETTFGELLFASISNFSGSADPFSSPYCLTSSSFDCESWIEHASNLGGIG